MKRILTAALVAQGLFFGAAHAQDNPFKSGWSLNSAGSELHFLSVKKGKLMELSSFANLNGQIDEDGNANFEIILDSVDTTIDLRNVRMRFLFFETFRHPKAVVSAKITPDMLGDLAQTGFKKMSLPVTVSLHGLTKEVTADVLVSLAGPDQVSIATTKPVLLKVEDFDLTGGLEKLQDAAEVTIVPSTSVTFSLTFGRNVASAPQVAAVETIAPRTAALEPIGAFDKEACEGRFEILSRTGNIYFEPGAAALKQESNALLGNVAFIVGKCPNMLVQVAGYTDSRGNSDYNVFLSEQRSEAVVNYLVDMGLPRGRFVSRGFGEANPIATNRTRVGRSKNRRIEFSVINNDNS